MSQLVGSLTNCLGALVAISAATKGTFLLLLVPLAYLYFRVQRLFRLTSTEVSNLAFATFILFLELRGRSQMCSSCTFCYVVSYFCVLRLHLGYLFHSFLNCTFALDLSWLHVVIYGHACDLYLLFVIDVTSY